MNDVIIFGNKAFQETTAESRQIIYDACSNATILVNANGHLRMH